MIIRTCAAFFFALIFLPAGLGRAILPGKGGLLQAICGFAASLSLFEILMLGFHATGGSLRLMVLLWSVLCAAGALYGFWKTRGKLFRGTAPRLAATEILLLAAVAAAVAVVTLNTVLNTTYVNWDDQTYCANAVGSWQSDLVNRLAPHSGTIRPPFYDKKYVIAGWSVYSSMLAVLSGLHPAIIFRTLLPLFEIPVAFGIIYLLLRVFFPKGRQKALLGVLYYLLFALAVSEKMVGNCSEWWLVVNCWTGKALSFSLVVPLVLWLLFRLEAEQDPAQRQAYWITLFLVGVCACNIAATMFMVLPIELGLWGLFYLYRTRRWNEIWKFILCGAPAVLCALVTL